MKQEYNTIVLGLGGIGSAALYWLSRRLGDQVLGIEQFEIGHSYGGSQDHSRIIRLSYHTPEYVALAKLAYAAWAGVEADDSAPLIVKTGGLDFAPPNSLIPIEDYTKSLTAQNVPYEWLDAGEIRYRWPQFQVDDDIGAIYQSESGIAPAAKCNAAHIRLARKQGAATLEHCPVEQIREVGNEVEVVANSTTYRCEKLIIAAGAWSNHHLAHFGFQLPLTITQEQVIYYDSPDPQPFMPERFPIWIWMDEPCYYGFPIYGESGPKVAQDVGGQETSVENRTYDIDQAAFERVDRFVQQFLPAAHAEPLYVKSCLYTMPPDREFILDYLPESKNVMIAIGAGHAFKFASVLGKSLSELALDPHTEADISPFRLARPILWEADPAQSFMV